LRLKFVAAVIVVVVMFKICCHMNFV